MRNLPKRWMQNAMGICNLQDLSVGLGIIPKFTVNEEGHGRNNKTPMADFTEHTVLLTNVIILHHTLYRPV